MKKSYVLVTALNRPPTPSLTVCDGDTVAVRVVFSSWSEFLCFHVNVTGHSLCGTRIVTEPSVEIFGNKVLRINDNMVKYSHEKTERENDGWDCTTARIFKQPLVPHPWEQEESKSNPMSIRTTTTNHKITRT